MQQTNIQSNMELKIHKDKYNYKTIELVSDTLPNGSVEGQMPVHSLRAAFDELLRELTLYNFDENTEEYKFVDEICNSLFE